MSDLDEGVPAWWDRLDEDQRSRIEQAAQTRQLDEDVRELLADTGCPMRSTFVKHSGTEGDTEGHVWQEPVREYVLLHAWWPRLTDSDRQIARRSLQTGYELESEAVEMFNRTQCPSFLGMHGYPPDPNSWVVSLPDLLHQFICQMADPPIE